MTVINSFSRLFFNFQHGAIHVPTRTDSYSLLPHKELRFVFYVLPLLTATAAVGLAHLVDAYKFAPVRVMSGWRVM